MAKMSAATKCFLILGVVIIVSGSAQKSVENGKAEIIKFESERSGLGNYRYRLVHFKKLICILNITNSATVLPRLLILGFSLF